MRYPSLIVATLAAFLCAAAPAAAKILITVNKSTQQMTVAVDGVTRWTWPVSTGRPSYDTPSGTHQAFRMEKDHFSKEWDDAPMPYSIFFTKEGHAIHGSYETRHLGSPASHGCVRLAPPNAAKLFALVEEEGVTNTTVVLTGDVRVAMARGGAVATARASMQPLALQPGTRPARYDQPPQVDAQPQYGYRQPQYGYPPPAYPAQNPFAQPFRPLFPFFR